MNTFNPNITAYRVTKEDSERFSKYGDTIVIKNYPEESVTYNLSTGKTYTTTTEEGTWIKDLNSFPLFDTEKANKEKWGF